jgi:hypothetical protein
MISLGAIVYRVRQASPAGGWHRYTSGHERVWLALRRPWLVWLALLIALAGTLVPGSSMHSHGSHSENVNAAERVEICTSAGQRWVVLDPAAPPINSVPEGPIPASGVDDCPFCLRHIERVAAPLFLSSRFFSDSGQTLTPVWIPTESWPPYKPIAPPPRGPPTFP